MIVGLVQSSHDEFSVLFRVAGRAEALTLLDMRFHPQDKLGMINLKNFSLRLVTRLVLVLDEKDVADIVVLDTQLLLNRLADAFVASRHVRHPPVTLMKAVVKSNGFDMWSQMPKMREIALPRTSDSSVAVWKERKKDIQIPPSCCETTTSVVLAQARH